MQFTQIASLQHLLTLKNLRLHTARFVTLLVALQILNAGFFVQDFQELTPASSLNDYNEINSIVEFVSEVVLEQVNSIPEVNNNSNKDLQSQKHFNYKIVEVKEPKIIVPVLVAHKTHTNKFAPPFYLSFCKDIISPPPKA